MLTAELRLGSLAGARSLLGRCVRAFLQGINHLFIEGKGGKKTAAGRQGFGGALLDVVLESVSSSGALCVILGSSRLHKRCLSKATLPGRVVMAKVYFMVRRRKRKNKEFPLETESCHLKLASGAAVCLCVHFW